MTPVPPPPLATRTSGEVAHPLAISALVALGGMTALSWEVLWQIEASLALGTSAWGTAVVLAVTMAGMTTGSLLAGRLLRRRSVAHPLRLYGFLELAIGVAGLGMRPGFGLLDRLDTALYGVSPTLAPVLHALGIALLIGPATLAMGASVPVFKLLGRAHGTSVALLYGTNTAGAAVGVLLFTFLLLPTLGVTVTCSVVAGIDISICIVAAILGGGGDAVPARTPIAAPASTVGARQPQPSLALATAVVFGTGFATFGLEVAWFRALRTAFQSTTDSFALMLAAVLASLAAGAHLAPALRRRGIGPALPLAAAGVAILASTPLVDRIDLFANVAGGYWTIVLKWSGLCLAILGPSMLLLGVALPWYMEAFPSAGATARLYGASTLGAVVGSLLTSWLLLPSIGATASAWAIGAIVVGLALAPAAPRMRVLALTTAAAALAVAVATSSRPGADRIPGFDSLGRYRVLAFEEGPDVSVLVVETPSRRERILLIDGFQTATELAHGNYMEWMGHLPMLLHSAPERALVICFGSGRTLNAVRKEGPVAVDVVELSPAVLRLAPLFPANEEVLEDGRVRAIVMDGRAWLRRTGTRYDVITLEPMPPNFAGVNSLYSQEFYALAAARLAPGGIVAQWLPIHLLSLHHAASVTATFASVFPDALLWMDPTNSQGILVGRQRPVGGTLGSEWPGLAREVGARELDAEAIRTAMALGPAGVARWAATGEVITDDNQLLAYGLEQRAQRTATLRLVRGDGQATQQLVTRHLSRIRSFAEAPSRLPESTLAPGGP